MYSLCCSTLGSAPTLLTLQLPGWLKGRGERRGRRGYKVEEAAAKGFTACVGKSNGGVAGAASGLEVGCKRCVAQHRLSPLS